MATQIKLNHIDITLSEPNAYGNVEFFVIDSAAYCEYSGCLAKEDFRHLANSILGFIKQTEEE